MDVNQSYDSDYFATAMNIESRCTTETNIMLYSDYIKGLKKKQSNREQALKMSFSLYL